MSVIVKELEKLFKKDEKLIMSGRKLIQELDEKTKNMPWIRARIEREKQEFEKAVKEYEEMKKAVLAHPDFVNPAL